MIDDVTPSTSGAPVEPPVIDPPADVAPPDTSAAPPPIAEPEPPPASWQEVETRISTHDPALAKAVAKLRGDASNEIGRARAEAARMPSIDEVILGTFQRRSAGLEAGDPYEGVEIPDPEAVDFAAVVGDVPDEALTDKEALKTFLVTTFTKAHEKSVAAARALARDTVSVTSRAAYAPLVERLHAEEVRRSAQENVTRLRRLPGMADQAAFDAVYAEMEKRDVRGAAGFRAIHSEMMEEHPEWMTAKAPAAATPEVIVRPPPPKPADPMDAARRASQAFGAGPSRRTPQGTTIPPNASQAERERIIGSSPEIRSVFAGDDDEPQHVRYRRLKASLGT